MLEVRSWQQGKSLAVGLRASGQVCRVVACRKSVMVEVWASRSCGAQGTAVSGIGAVSPKQRVEVLLCNRPHSSSIGCCFQPHNPRPRGVKSLFLALSHTLPPGCMRSQVAEGGGAHEALPMLLRVPVFSLPPDMGGYSMLGFGDIILPGALSEQLTFSCRT